MKTPLLIAMALTALMIAVHIGLFWWFVLRPSKEPPTVTPAEEPGDSDKGDD